MDAIFSLVIKGILIVSAVAGVFFTQKYFKTKDDNLIEEIVEHEIKKETGFDIDLSPDSPDGSYLELLANKQMVESID